MKKIIMVTGASSGFGALAARQLATAGDIVYASMRETKGRNAKQVAEVEKYAKENDVDLRSLDLDVASQESSDNAVKEIVAKCGRLDVIVHNAGHMVFGPAEAFTTDQYAELYDINVLGTQRVNRATLPQLRKQGKGLLVWVGSTSTRQLLLFSRREVFQPRDLDLSESITSTAKMLRRILGENIQVQLKLASQPMFLNADAGMMDQILMNLCVNARDAMPNGGQLIIETSGVEFDEFATTQSSQARPGSFVCLSVSDSGCGISPEIVPKIFEPFFTTKDVGKGTGLGLATVFGIVQQHQGWINVYSEVNHGTTLRIYLPRLAKNGGVKSSQSVLTEMRGGNETILLAEDDPSLRVAVRKALAQLGYRILEAPTGVKALEVWKQNRNEIRLLLTDLVMPDGMTGKDLADRLLQENPKLKVIYMSGYSAEVVGKNFPLKEGVNFLTKPFQAAKLAQTIRIALDV